MLAEALKAQRACFGSNAGAACKTIAVGESPAPTDVAPSELAAYTMVASLLMNLDEAITKN